MTKEYKNITINETPEIKEHKRKIFCTKELKKKKKTAFSSALAEITEV
jgi:hypothetical protein